MSKSRQTLLPVGLVLRGVVVDYVLVGSAAFKSKLISPGDTILSVDGNPVGPDGKFSVAGEQGLEIVVEFKNKAGEINKAVLVRKGESANPSIPVGETVNSIRAKQAKSNNASDEKASSKPDTSISDEVVSSLRHRVVDLESQLAHSEAQRSQLQQRLTQAEETCQQQANRLVNAEARLVQQQEQLNIATTAAAAAVAEAQVYNSRSNPSSPTTTIAQLESQLRLTSEDNRVLSDKLHTAEYSQSQAEKKLRELEQRFRVEKGEWELQLAESEKRAKQIELDRRELQRLLEEAQSQLIFQREQHQQQQQKVLHLQQQLRSPPTTPSQAAGSPISTPVSASRAATEMGATIVAEEAVLLLPLEQDEIFAEALRDIDGCRKESAVDLERCAAAGRRIADLARARYQSIFSQSERRLRFLDEELTRFKTRANSAQAELEEVKDENARLDVDLSKERIKASSLEQKAEKNRRMADEMEKLLRDAERTASLQTSRAARAEKELKILHKRQQRGHNLAMALLAFGGGGGAGNDEETAPFSPSSAARLLGSPSKNSNDNNDTAHHLAQRASAIVASREAWAKNLAMLEAQIRLADESANEKAAELDKAKSRITELMVREDELQKLLFELEAQCTRLKEEQKMAQIDASQTNEEFDNKISRAAQLSQEAQKAMIERENTIRELQDRLRDETSKRSVVETNLEEMSKVCARFEKENTELRAHLVEKEREARSATAEVAGLRKERQQTAEENEKRLSAARMEVSKLGVELREANQKTASLNTALAVAREECDIVRKQIQEAANEAQSWKQEYEKLQKQNEEQSRKDKKAYEDQYMSLAETHSKLKTSTEAAERHFASELATLRKNNEDLEKNLQASLADTAAAQGRFTEISEEVKRLRESLALLEKEKAHSEQQRQDTTRECEKVIAEWERANLSLKQRVDELERTLEDAKSVARDKIDALQAEFEALRNLQKKEANESAERERKYAAQAEEANASRQVILQQLSRLQEEKDELQRSYLIAQKALETGKLATAASLKELEERYRTSLGEMDRLRQVAEEEVARLRRELDRDQSRVAAAEAAANASKQELLRATDVMERNRRDAETKFQQMESSARSAKEYAEQELSSLESEMARLSTRLAIAEEKRETTEREAKDLVEELKQKIELAMQSVGTERARADAATSEVNVLRKQNADAAESNRNLQRNVATFSAELAAASNRSHELEMSEKILKERLGAVEKQCQSQQEENSSLASVIVELRGRLAAQEQSFNSTIADLQRRLEESALRSSRELDAFRKKVEDEKRQILKDMQDKLEQLQRAKEEAEKELLHQLDAERAARQQYASENGVLIGRVEALSSRASSLESELSRDRKVMDEREAELADLQAELHQLRIRADEAEKQLQTIRAELLASQKDLQAKVTELARSVQQVQQLQADLDSTRQQLAQLSTAYGDEQRNHEVAKAKLEEMQRESSKVQGDLSRLRSMEVDYQDVVRKLSDRNGESASLKAGIEGLQLQIDDKERIVSDLTQKLGAALEKARLNDVIGSPSSSSLGVGESGWKQEIARIQQRMESALREKEAIEQRSRERDSELEGQVAQLQNELGEMRGRIEEQRIVMQQALNSEREAKAAVEAIQNELAVAKTTAEKVMMESAARARKLEVKATQERRRCAELTESLDALQSNFDAEKERWDKERRRMQEDTDNRINFLQEAHTTLSGTVEGLTERLELQDKELERLNGVIRRQRDALAESDRAMSSQVMVHSWKGHTYDDENPEHTPALV